MRKYLALLKCYFAATLNKRGDFISQALLNLVSVSATLFLWLAVYDPKKSINGYSLQDTILYYVFMLLMTFATNTNTTDYIAKNIKMGTLSEWLLKPRSVLVSEFMRAWADQLNRLVIIVPIYILVMILISILPLGVVFSVSGIVLSIIFTQLGFCLNVIFEYTIALAAFWMDEVWSLKHFKGVITDTLGGKRFPPAFFPLVIQNILHFLPFQFLYFVPLEYLLNKRSFGGNLGTDLAILLGWFVILLIIANILYRLGIKRYGAFGN